MRSLQVKMHLVLFCVALALVMSSFTDHTKLIYDQFLFYLEGTYSEYLQWFPRFGLWLYMLLILLKIAGLALTGYLFWRLKKYLSKKLAEESTVMQMHRFILRELLLFSIILILYLVLYFKFRMDQLLIARFFLLHFILQVLWIFITEFKRIIAYLRKYLLEPQLPYNISILRIFFFGYVIFVYSSYLAMYLPVVSLENKEPLPFIGWLIELIPVSKNLYMIFVYAGMLSAFMVVIGFKTRVFLIIHAICCFYIVSTPNFFGKLWHNQLIIWASWFFAFSKCYDVFSLDAYFKKTPLHQSADYTFPVRFIWLQLGVMYFWAGFYKLWDAGFDWALSQSMVNQMQLEWLQDYDRVPALRIDQVPWLVYVGGLFVILFELSYLFFVLNKTWRWVAVAGGLLMHNLIGYFMYIAFPALQMLYLFYFDFNLFFRKKLETVTSVAPHFSKKALYAGVFILSMNFVFGMLSINTYPFSAYPVYSDIVPDRARVLEFKCPELGVSVHEIGRRNNFSWESYGRMEASIIQDFEDGKNVQKEAENYWKIWVSYNPELSECSQIEVSLVERPVSPEGKKNLKTIGYICTIIPGK